jgi:hypothetical protein
MVIIEGKAVYNQSVRRLPVTKLLFKKAVGVQVHKLERF